jgi:uncharacterized protein DUF2490
VTRLLGATRIRFRCLIVLCLALPAQVNAQTPTATPVNFALWLGYEGNHPLREVSPWRFVIETTAKRNRGFAVSQGDEIESGLGYEFKGHQQISGGFIFEYHIPFDSASQPYKWPEYNVYQKAAFPIKFDGGRKTFEQHFALEERFLAQKLFPDFDKIISYRYETTFKYQLGFELPLHDRASSILYDEIHLRGSPRREKLIDENRLFGGIRFPLDSESRTNLEVGYMLQTARHSSATASGRERINHTIRIRIVSDAPLK